MNENFYEVSEDTINDFFEVFDKKSFPIKIDFQFLGHRKQKGLIKISKISDQYSAILAIELGSPRELLVTINEDLMDAFDEESRTILIEQEIDKINMNVESGKIKLVKTDLNTFASLVNKYGVEKVSRANQVESLFIEQKEDSEDDDFIV
jgi:soluble cytochrome b562